MIEPIWIDAREALAIHDLVLSIHGGPAGVRDLTLLESALARPKQLLAYSEDLDVIEFAAAYTAGIIRNHPFVDGNKRTGFVVGILFLELNGYVFLASEEDAANAVQQLAGSSIDEKEYANFLRRFSRLA